MNRRLNFDLRRMKKNEQKIKLRFEKNEPSKKRRKNEPKIKLRFEKNEPSKKRRDKAKSSTRRHTYEERHR